MGRYKGQIYEVVGRRLYKKDGKVILRTCTKKNKEILKALVHHRKRRTKYGKISSTRFDLERQQWRTYEKAMAIRIRIYRLIRKRTNNQLYNEVYHKNGRKTQGLYTYDIMQCRHRKWIP